MRIPVRYSPILFGALLSAVMVAIVSAFVLATSRGLDSGFLSLWMQSCVKTWPIAFASVTLLAPQVRKLVARLVQAPA